MTLNDLKPGWQILKFEDFAENVAIRVSPSKADTDIYVGLEHLDPETIHLRSWGHPSDVDGDKLRFQKGDVIFGRRRAYQRKLAVAEFDGICSAHAMVIRAKPKKMLPEFLPFFLYSDMFMERAIEISVGSLSPTINWKTLKIQEFPVPSLDEQKRIAEILWAADDVFETKVSLASELLKAKAAYIIDLYRNGIGHTSFKKSIIGKIPDNWRVLRLAELCDFLDGKRIPIKQADRAKRQGEFPYYGASGVIDWIDDYIFDDELILIGEDGANIVDRSTPLAFKVSGKIWVNNHAHVLKPHNFVNIDFLVEYLESISYSPYTSGTAQPKINKSACESIPIPVPPIEEQIKIADILRAYDEQINNTRATINSTKQLLKALTSDNIEGVMCV